MRIFFLSVFLCFALIVGMIGYRVLQFWGTRSPDHEVELSIPQGASFRQIAFLLSEQKLIRDPYLFEIWARIYGATRRVHAGQYRFPAAEDPHAILKILMQGQVHQSSLTIPEGWTMAQVATLLAEKTGESSESLLATLKDPTWLREQSISGASAEGYLFPETYAYDAGTSGQEILKRMIATFHERIDPLWKSIASHPLGSLGDVLVLASIVEREARLNDERPIIAAVYLNRLRLGMPLQADPTVIYGIDGFDGNLRRKDLRTDQPYNTYTRPGLPPTPIANPGLASIKAVLYPAQVPYLYFVAKGDGSHAFSERLNEHNDAVHDYQIAPAQAEKQAAAIVSPPSAESPKTAPEAGFDSGKMEEIEHALDAEPDGQTVEAR